MAVAPSGHGLFRLLGLARLGAHRLAGCCGPDDRRPAGRPGHSLAGFWIRPELGAAGRRELVLFSDHAGSHAADVRNLCAAKPKRVAGAGLLLLGGVGLAGGRPDRNRQRRGQQQSKLKISRSKNRHPSPRAEFGGIVGERIGIRKHGWTRRHSPSVAVGFATSQPPDALVPVERSLSPMARTDR